MKTTLAEAGAARQGRPIKVAQIGVGHMHAFKYAALQQLTDHFEVVGVVAEDADAQRTAAHEPAFTHARWLSEADVLSDPSIEAVLVETVETLSVETAQRCIEAGKHIHLDKPGGEDAAAFRALIAAAERRSLTVQLGYMYRNNAAIQFCIDAVRSGLIGTVFEIDAVMSRWDGPELRAFYKTFDAGAGHIYMCHLVDLVVALMGRPDRTSAFRARTQDDGLVDQLASVLEYDSGCIAMLRTSVVEVDAFRRRHLVVAGERGTIVVDPLEVSAAHAGGEVWLTLDEARGGWQSGRQQVPVPRGPGRYDDQLMEFARIVRGEIPNPYPSEHELAVQETFLAACGSHDLDTTR